MLDKKSVDILTVSYNAPELIERLLSSIRNFYENKVIVIDGSDDYNSKIIEGICKKFSNIEFIHFNYNIHHGPGLAWAYQNLNLSDQVLVLDSDVIFLKPGMIESLSSELTSEMYGVGYINTVNRDGFNIENQPNAVRYLQPACMLCNIAIVRKHPMPIKHGAPNITPMLEIHDAENHHLIRNIQWVEDDMNPLIKEKNYIQHDWQGTVNQTGGYHLEEWMQEVIEKQKREFQKNSSPEHSLAFNHDLLALIPKNSSFIIEVGCSNGALAAAYLKENHNTKYIGIEIDANKANIARNYCHDILQINIENVGDDFFEKYKDVDVWVFGDVLEHLQDPWGVLRKIRRVLPKNGSIIVSLPNVQHWSIQLKLAVGDFRYDPAGGLLDKTHLRFFTRTTMLEMFAEAGFEMEAGFPRIIGDLTNPHIIEAIRLLATAAGVDPEVALNDSIAFQYVVKFVPLENSV